MERRQPLSEEEVEWISQAIVAKTQAAFHIEEEKHYNSHQRLDRLLDAYDSATNIFSRTFFGLLVIGAIIFAGMASVKGIK
jgi:hypothetical protein